MEPISAALIHDLRTPLVGIEALAKRALDESRAGHDATQYIDRILRQTRLLREQLSFFRFASALATDERLSLNLRDLPVREIGRIIEASLADFSLLGGSRNISYTFSLNPSAGGRFVVADRDCFDQTLYAVLDNAFRYAYHDSRITVTLRKQRSKAIEIAVNNRGLRLCAEDIPNIFRRGWRSPLARATANGGGVGLWVAQALINAMHGTLSVLPTNEQEITTALIQLPLSR
jgi:signal transduction histidine kinase